MAIRASTSTAELVWQRFAAVMASVRRLYDYFVAIGANIKRYPPNQSVFFSDFLWNRYLSLLVDFRHSKYL